jgi:acetolactate synthase small subunit
MTGDVEARAGRILNARAQDHASALNRILAEALDEGFNISVVTTASGRTRAVEVAVTPMSDFEKELHSGR